MRVTQQREDGQEEDLRRAAHPYECEVAASRITFLVQMMMVVERQSSVAE